MLRRLLRALRRDDGSLPLAMMLTLVGTSLSTLMVPIVITQLRDTAETVERAKALHAAQAGIDVVLGSIRASAGTIANLLCLPAADPLLGTVGGGLPGRYKVSVVFQDSSKTALPCATRAGHLVSVPSFAVITATGTAKGNPGQAFDPAASRTLNATYVFRFTNENIEGGLVKFYGGAYCLDAGSGSPAVGTNVTTQPCSTGSARQTFAYTKNLTLQLVSSKTAANPLGMCLDSGDSPVSGTLVQFQVCGSPTIPYYQRWSINDSSNFQSTASNGSSLGSFCFHAKSGSTPGAFVELVACGGAADNTRTFAPEASVGAGAAGPPYQIVNFKQFGRCIDVTNFDITIGYIIVWPCKQAPNPLSVGWNQRWNIPATGTGLGSITGQIWTYDSSKTKQNVCMTTAEPGAASYFVTMKACPATTDAGTLWTVSYQETTYGASYVIKDHNGMCLTPTNLDDPKLPPGDIFKGSTTVSKLVVAACDGSKLQKWNAPANIEDPTPLKNIGEK
ncbi:RICIN domain-containing protein [Dactylosporangium sp. CA-139114]|uniref:RICIN domain-containing protein n=1 Tax=Dactylosporangium sp. CA-139114 TaxID=3239931 RepID=UPI003D99D2CF